VTTAAVLAPHLEPETVASSPEAATFQPEHEIVRLLAERSRATVASLLAAAGESLAGSTSCQHAAPHATSHLTHCNGVAGDVVAPGQRQAHAEHPRRGRVSPGAMGDYDVRLTITQAEHAELVRAQAALAELTRPLVVRGERMARCTA
jgi:hypothetical protein